MDPLFRRHISGLLVLLCSVSLLGACHGGESPSGDGELPRTLTVFAAASLQDVLADLAEAWQRRTEGAHGIEVVFSFAGSNVLAQQILAAPGADLFVSADRRWMDEVVEKGRVEPGSRVEVLTNVLVLIGRHDSDVVIRHVGDLADASFRGLAVGDPDSVPAGVYAKAALEKAGIWNRLTPKLVPSSNVRAALALVESDPEILGVVYRTDAASSARVRIILELEPTPGLEVMYSAGLVRDGADSEAARSFLEFLGDDAARAVARSHGFGIP